MAGFVIDYFELPSTDLPASRAFFEAAFGFSHVDYGPDYSEITGAGVLGGLNAMKEAQAPLVGIRTEDIDGAVTAITAAGGVLVTPIVDYPGGRRCQFREPGGAVLLLYCPAE